MASTKQIISFDPEKGTLEQHIYAQLQYEMLNCKRPYRLHGVTGLPANYISFYSLPKQKILISIVFIISNV